jgi:hypothetical protein
MTTVVVIGAGASKAFGLPLGGELSKLVGEQVTLRRDDYGNTGWSNSALHSAFRNVPGFSASEMGRASHRIASGISLLRSVDDYLYIHGEDQAVVQAGKAAIAAVILEAESKSPLRYLDHYDQERAKRALIDLGSSWISTLVGLLSPRYRTRDADRIFEDITFINFNYDRCVEVALASLLVAVYGIEQPRAQRIVSQSRIIHPYGRIGLLPWEGDPSGFSFGSEPQRIDLIAASQRIRTLTEPYEIDQDRALISTAFDEAARVVFLGFGFHEQNCDLLFSGVKRPSGAPVNVFATAFGGSQSDLRLWKRAVADGFQGSPTACYFEDLSCDDMLTKVGREAILGR